jgi:hypothetical protein
MTDLFAVAQNRLLWQWKKFDVEFIPIYFTVSVTGTGWTEVGIETIVIAYVDALEAGGDIVAADLTALLVADSTIDTVDSLEFSRLPQNVWENNPPETVTLEIFSVERATTSAPLINTLTQVEIWISTTPNGTGFNAQTIKDAITAWGSTFSHGDDVVKSELITVIESVSGVTEASGTYIDSSTFSPPNAITTISISSSELATFDDARIAVILG